MKKLIFIACFALAAAGAANAQWYVGGNVSYTSANSSSQLTGSDKTEYKSRVFGITPRVGYIFNDRWSVGLGLGYRFSKPDGDDANGVRKQAGFSVSPYTRFNLVWFGPFSIAAEAMAGFGRTKAKPADGAPFKDMKANVFQAKLAPVLQLDVSRHIDLECRLDFFSVGYYYSKSTVEYESGGKTTGKRKEFDAGVKGDEIFTTGNLTFGLIYKF